MFPVSQGLSDRSRELIKNYKRPEDFQNLFSSVSRLSIGRKQLLPLRTFEGKVNRKICFDNLQEIDRKVSYLQDRYVNKGSLKENLYKMAEVVCRLVVLPFLCLKACFPDSTVLGSVQFNRVVEFCRYGKAGVYERDLKRFKQKESENQWECEKIQLELASLKESLEGKAIYSDIFPIFGCLEEHIDKANKVYALIKEIGE